MLDLSFGLPRNHNSDSSFCLCCHSHQSTPIKVGISSPKIFRYSEKVYSSGVETKLIGGYPVKIYNIEKILADCVKFRNKIGMDVVIEALKYWQRKGAQVDKLYEYAKINCIEKILQPIMETIVSQ